MSLKPMKLIRTSPTVKRNQNQMCYAVSAFLLMFSLISCDEHSKGSFDGNASPKTDLALGSDPRNTPSKGFRGDAGGELLPSARNSLSESSSPAQIEAWHRETMKKGSLSQIEASELAAALKRIANRTGKELSEVAGELLRGLGEGGDGGSLDLLKALKSEPKVYVQAVLNGLDGKIQKIALIRCFSVYAMEENTGALSEIYNTLTPGSLRSTLAEKYAKTELIKNGVDASLGVIRNFEYPEERRQALMQVSRVISAHREMIDSDATLLKLREMVEQNELKGDVLRDLPSPAGRGVKTQ